MGFGDALWLSRVSDVIAAGRLSLSSVVSRQHAHAMKTNAKIILLAVSCFLAGFITRSWLTPHRPVSPTPTAPAVTPFAMLTPPMVSTQVFHIDDGVWYVSPDGTRSRTPPPMPQPTSSEEMLRTHPGYYDLIDTRYRPDIDSRDLK